MGKNILVTGGCGFIGSHFLRCVLEKEGKDSNVYNLDCLSYAGDKRRLKDINQDSRYHFVKGDIRKNKDLEKVFAYDIDMVVHFAAESHVDNSISNPHVFEEVNVRGTLNLLNFSREHGVEKFIYVSTDEVYGDIVKGKFTEKSPIRASSPYSASKAAGDLFVSSYIRTYSFPATIVRCSNNYGSWQYPEKFIPVVICNALNDQPIPVYAKGENVREWIHAADCAEAIYTVLKKSKGNDVFNIGSGIEKTNIDIAKTILDILGKPHSLIKFVEDRPGHDWRYSLDSKKIKQTLGWKPKFTFKNGMKETVKWFRDNHDWWEKNYKKI